MNAIAAELAEELAAPTESAKKLLLDPAADAPALAASFERILGYATAWAARADLQPEKAVHEFRKSVRRGRTLVKLAAGFLPKRKARAAESELRDVARSTSLLRDLDVLAAHVAERERIAPEVQAALASVIDAERAQRPHHVTPVVVLAAGAARIAPLVASFAGGLPEKLPAKGLEKALRRSYEASRHAFAEARGGAGDRDEALHTFRKRVKELRYQLELLRAVAPTGPALERLATLAEALGAVTDLMIMRDYARDHREQLSADPEAFLVQLGSEIDAQRATVLDGVAPFFAPKPRAFAKALFRPEGEAA